MERDSMQTGESVKKKAKRPAMDDLCSRQFQSQNGTSSRKSSVVGARAALHLILPIRTHSGVTRGKPWTRTNLVGVLREVKMKPDMPEEKLGTIEMFDFTSETGVIAIPPKIKIEDLEENMSRLKNVLPDEVLKEFPVYAKKNGSLVEICTFDTEQKWISSLEVGDMVGLGNLVYGITFSRGSQPTINDDGRLQGVERTEGVPYMSFDATLRLMHKAKSQVEVKALLAEFGLGRINSFCVGNPFLNERGGFVLPADLLAVDETGMDLVPIFTRFTPEQLDMAYWALYRSNQFGCGVIRNRIIGVPKEAEDDVILQLLEPAGGLPVYYSATIPRKEENDATDLFVSKKTGEIEKCFRGPKPTKCAILNEYPGDSSGMYDCDVPKRCLAVVAYNQKAGEACTYVCNIGINSPVAWERYAPQIFRGLDAIFIVEYTESGSEGFNMSMAPKENGCSIGIMGQISMMPDFYATFMTAGIRVPQQTAIAILQAGMISARVANKVSDVIKDQYATVGATSATDCNAQKYLQDDKFTTHVFLNAFAGDVDKLPTDSDPHWIYVAVPAEGTLTDYQLREKDNSDPIIIRKQRFFERNSSEKWQEENLQLLEEWKRTPGAYEKLGVFLVKKNN